MSVRNTATSLLERLRDPSDADAWRRFHDLYGPLIHDWLMRRGLTQVDADDVQQEVFQRAILELPKFRHNGRVGALRCWLRQVVANRLKTFWRQNNRHRAAGGSDGAAMADQLADPNSRLSRQWDEEYRIAICDRLLELAKGNFEPQTIEAFRRVVLEGKKPAEVAAALGTTANAVRIAQSRVLRLLRELGDGMLD